MKLSEMFEAAGITEYVPWSKEITVAPDGNPAFNPRSYQITGLNHMAAFLPRCGIFDDPGTGKTLQLQAFNLWMTGLGNSGVVLMPPNLVPQYRASFYRDFQGLEEFVKIGTIHGDRDQRQRQIDLYQDEGWPDVLIMSYPTFLGKYKAPRKQGLTKKQVDQIIKTGETDPEAAGKLQEGMLSALHKSQAEEDTKYRYRPGDTITAHNFRAEVLVFKGYKYVVADEAHKLKRPDSNIHQTVRDFVSPWAGEDSRGLVLATGSPIETNVEDAFGIINLIDPDIYGTKRRFDAQHCVFVPNVPFRKVMEYTHLDQLHRNLFARARRVTKRAAFPEMPERVISEIPLKLSSDHKALYDKLVEERVLELGDGVIDATTQQALYQYTQRILICPEAVTDKPPKSNALLDAVDDILDQLGNRKMILFCWYQESADKLMKHYADHNPVLINGTTSGTVRERAKSRFINDPSCQLLVVNPVSGGVGLDGFQKVCSYAVFVEVCPWPGRFEQAIGRLERSGQTESVTIYLLVPRGTVAVKLRNDLCKKESDAHDAVRDKTTLMADLLGEDGIQGVIK